ncbi:MAG TPA: hypothetical protein PLX31_24395 [Gemmatimonadaceae bacterium]|nr:hypothetical protein [Gemmatimonadaceae bacterium]
MAAITPRFGSGGANLAPGGAAGAPSLAEALRDVADDLAALKPTVVVAADAGAAYGAHPAEIPAALRDLDRISRDYVTWP